MNTRIAFPFLTLSDDAVSATPWKIGCGDGDLQTAGDFLEDWDCATPLRLYRKLKLNPEVASLDLDLGMEDLGLAVSLRLGTGQGRMPRSIIQRVRQVLDLEHPEIEFDLHVEGSSLSMVVDMQTQIFLGRRTSSAGDLSPSREGDRLWQDTKRVRLEGEEPRFPIEVADLGALLGDSSAAWSPWYLHWSPRDWTRDFHGSMRLYLNVRHKELISRVESEDPETLRSLMADVMGQVCESLVRDEEAKSVLEGCEEGSLGRQASFWLELAFPGRGIEYARSVLENRPGVFRASFQAVAEQQGEVT